MTATPTPEPLITLRDVTVGYANQDVVSGASLAIPAGAFVAFVGPNGAGKTTLLRAILGLIPLRRGAILTPFRRSPPGYVPQARVVDPLYPVSLRDIASMGLYPRLGPLRRPSPGHRRLVDQTLQRFDLAQHARKAWRELSGGMKQKTLIARAIVADPQVIIMDEPTLELDQASEREVLHLLRRENHEHGRTVLIAHHGLGDLDACGARVVRINHGRLESVGGAA
ncbi:MAG TPA: ATP-binding cassette domain-containing protein [Candidatus Brocadiia bacterium]|nr:ATP-binding cassette domain-containing protein [Candidatus Brocadiia bacterium]